MRRRGPTVAAVGPGSDHDEEWNTSPYRLRPMPARYPRIYRPCDYRPCAGPVPDEFDPADFDAAEILPALLGSLNRADALALRIRA